MKLTNQEDLTSREIQIIELISQGKSRNEIAQLLGISKLTYDSHRKHIRIKMGIKSQADWLKLFNTTLHIQSK